MMTAAQLEIAAREYCRLMNVNPDEEIAQASNAGVEGADAKALSFVARWKIVAERISQVEIMQHCIEVAKSTPNRRNTAAPATVGARMQRILSWFPSPRDPEIEARIEI